MARYYAEIQGNRGRASRLGTAKSGISGHIRGWNLGCAVEVSPSDLDEDTLYVYLTGGSNGGERVLLFQGTKKKYLDLLTIKKEIT